MLAMPYRLPIPWIMLCLLWALLFLVTAQRTALTQTDDATGFSSADTNHDGIIDHKEWDQFSARLFGEIDKDGDGQGSSEELAQSFDTFDYNKDGVIDGREAPLIIVLGDASGDGVVDREEFNSINWTRETVDTNRDGTVSQREFSEARREVFNRADLDRDRRLRRHEFDDAATMTLFRF